MANEYKFTEEDVTELISEDLSIAASLATLIIENGDIRAFLVKKLLDREEELAVFHLSQSPRWIDNEKDDWNSIQDGVDAREARYINQTCFGN